jgi:small-conductance mechanosensitive channel
MGFLAKSFYNNTIQSWLIAAAVAAAVWLVVMIAKGVLHRKIKARAAKTVTKVDDLIALLIKKIKPLFVLVIAVYMGALSLKLPPSLAAVLSRLAVLALLLQGAVWGSHIITYWIGRTREKREEGDKAGTTVMGLLNFFVRAVLWAVVLLLVLDNFGVNITTLIAGLGIGGVAVALALQRVLGDLLASLSIVLDKPFLVGDFIIIGDYLGTVEHIGIMTTRIRSLGGEELVFGNNDLLQSRIRNYKRMAERRVVFSVGVTYQTAPDKMKAIPGLIKAAVESQANTRFDRSNFKAFGDFSMNFETVYWVLSPDYNLYMNIQEAINLNLLEKFAAQGIEFAYPTQTLFLERSGGPEQGVRAPASHSPRPK